MTGSRMRWLVTAQAVLILLLLALLGWRAGGGRPPQAVPAAASQPAARGGGDDDAPHHAAAGEGATADGSVRLSAALQHASGLVLAPLRAAAAPPSGEVWGEVLGSEALAAARLRLRQADADAAQYDAALVQARREAGRLDALWTDDGNVARRQVDQAHADLLQLEQRQAAAQGLRQAVRAQVRAEWGGALLHELEQPDGGALADVLAGSQRLLLLPVGAPATVHLGLPGQAGLEVAARRLAPASQALGGSSLPTWYWLASAEPLRAGQRVRLLGGSAAGAAGSGVEVPESAVVWLAGQAWVYQPQDAEHFQRVAIHPGAAIGSGWFAAAPLAPGQQVVVQGAQLLLSEESKALIRNENGD